MAFRFRRSMKLGKGLKLNVSKRGVGMSFGTNGLRKSVHSTGSRTSTIGIPGTGLSYVDRTYGKKKSSNRKRASAEQKKHENTQAVEAFNRYIQTITALHQQTIDPIDWKRIVLTPKPFAPEGMGPRETKAREAYQNYTFSFLERIFKNLADKKRSKLTRAIHDAEEADADTYRKWENTTEIAASVLEGEPEAYQQVVTTSRKFHDMRNRITLHVVSPQTVEMDVQVASKDIVPKKNVQLTKTGKVSKRKMGKKKYYALVQAFVCSHAIWAARSLFATLPIDTCIIHMTETAINTSTGHYEQRILLSVSFDRNTLDQLQLSRIEPADAMNNFQHHMDFLVTKGFRAVKRVQP